MRKKHATVAPKKHTTIAISRPLKRELDELQDELNVCLSGSGNRLATKDQLLSYMLDCANKHLYESA